MAELIPYGATNSQERLSAIQIDAYDFMRRPNVNPMIDNTLYPAEFEGLVKDLSMGDWMRVQNQEYFWTEGNALFARASTFAGAAADARSNTGSGTGIVNGVTVSLTGTQWVKLAPSSCLPAVATPSLAAGTTTLIREGNIIDFPVNGRLAQFLVVYVDVRGAFDIRLYLKKVNGNILNIETVLPATGGNVSSKLFNFQQNVDSEGGIGMTKSITSTYNTYSAKLTPVTEDYTITDMAKNTQYWYTGIKNPDGTRQLLMYRQQYDNTLTRLLGAVRTRLARGVNFASDLTDYAGQKLSGSNGFITEFEEKSTGITYNIFTTQTIQQIDATRREKKMSHRLDFLEGAKFTYALNDWRSETFSNGAIVYDNKMFDLNFDTIEYGEMKINRRSLNVLNDPDVLGMPGSPYPDMCFIIPSDKIAVQVMQGQDKVSVKAKNLTFLYNFDSEAQDTGIANSISSTMPRFFRSFEVGGLAKIPTDTRQICETHFVSTVGSALHAASQSMILTKQG
jgi:hypothetical protein